VSVLHPARHAITLNGGAGLCSLLGFAGWSYFNVIESYLFLFFVLRSHGLRSRVLSQNHYKVMSHGQSVPSKPEGGMYISFIIIFISYSSFYALDLKTLFLSPRS